MLLSGKKMTMAAVSLHKTTRLPLMFGPSDRAFTTAHRCLPCRRERLAVPCTDPLTELQWVREINRPASLVNRRNHSNDVSRHGANATYDGLD